MYMVTLICNPEKAALDPHLVENLRSAWGGGAVTWLSVGEAAEFQVAQKPDTFESVWHDVQATGVDLVILPTQNRRKRILIADMDSRGCFAGHDEGIGRILRVGVWRVHGLYGGGGRRAWL